MQGKLAGRPDQPLCLGLYGFVPVNSESKSHKLEKSILLLPYKLIELGY